MNDVPWVQAATLGPEAAHETWALAARNLLADLAGEYHAVITVPELAQQVQERSRIRTRSVPGNWMGDVLYRVAVDCQRRRQPLLNSLCVQANGVMGDWYADTVVTVRGDRIADPEQHAAEERLDCYRAYGADLPEGGGVAALPPRPERPQRAQRQARAERSPAGPRTARAPRAARTTAAPRPAKVEAAPKVCPTCFMALPATGRCDTCD